MTISVIIGTYNRAAMVRQAIQAALQQTRPPDEIIVADDGSLDSTWQGLLAEERDDGRVRIFRRDQNSGGAQNWNDAVAQASGDYLALCSDDDRFCPDHLEASAAYLEAHPEIGFVHSSFVDALEREGRSELIPRAFRGAQPLIVNRRNLLPYLIRYYDWPFHPSTIVMRRAVWEGTGCFDPAYALMDTDWFVRAVERFPTAMLPRHGVINRRHAGNWSNRLGSAHMQREIFEIGEKVVLRQWPRPGIRRMFWRTCWRATVRLRLLLTLRARLKTGHADAAVAVWQGFCRSTGRRLGVRIENSGEVLIRRYLVRSEVQGAESVSPL